MIKSWISENCCEQVKNNIHAQSVIYCIQQKSTGRKYIGSAKHFGKRLARHRFDLTNGSHHSKFLQRSVNKYPNDFEVLLVERVSPSMLIEREQYWIDFIQPEFNSLKIANSSIGYKHTSETKQKMKANKNITIETLKNLSASHAGLTRVELDQRGMQIVKMLADGIMKKDIVSQLNISYNHMYKLIKWYGA